MTTSSSIAASGPELWAVGAVDGTARIALLVVVVLLVAIVAAVAALAIVMRRRTARPAEPEAIDVAPAPVKARTPTPPRSRRVPTSPGGSVGGLVVATSGMVCPTCRTEYSGMTYCTRDARRLVPAEDMLAGGRSGGGVCVSCRRAYEPGLRRCPHDGGELVPASVAAALRGKRVHDAPTGVMAKSCPACRHRFDLAARFCGHDGTELVVVN